MGDTAAEAIRKLIRDVPDFPEPGILFKDIMPLLADPEGLEIAVDALAAPWRDQGVETVAGIEARGFILAAPVARALGAGFMPVRKAGKLPGDTVSETYDLEYGTDTVEIHVDALAAGRRIVVIDDVLATGGTAAATGRLIRSTGADLLGFGFLLQLAFLGGRDQLVDPFDVVLTIDDHGEHSDDSDGGDGHGRGDNS